MKSRNAFDALREAACERTVPWALVALRLTLGVLFLGAGWSKLTSDWSASSYLEAATGPLAGWFQAMAGSPFVDALNAWGLLALGAALLLGLCVRLAGAGGVMLMALYYLAHFEQNTAHGIVDEHIVYIVALLVLMSSGAGHVLGLDALVDRTRAVLRYPWVRWLLG